MTALPAAAPITSSKVNTSPINFHKLWWDRDKIPLTETHNKQEASEASRVRGGEEEEEEKQGNVCKKQHGAEQKTDRGAERLHPPALPRTPYLPQILWGVLCGGGGGGNSWSVATHVSPLLSTPRLSSSPSPSLDPLPPFLSLSFLSSAQTLRATICPRPPACEERGGGGGEFHSVTSTGAPTQVPRRFRRGSHSGGGTIRCKAAREAAAGAAAQTQACHCFNSIRTASSTHLADGGLSVTRQSCPALCL